MNRRLLIIAALFAIAIPVVAAAGVQGIYMETRTCQIYTGPCFANGELAVAGREAIMAWKIQKGGMDDKVNLAGLSVVVVLRASNTLREHGLKDAKYFKIVILVDERATPQQRDALIRFAKKQTQHQKAKVVRVASAPIAMSLDRLSLRGDLTAGKEVKMSTRKARPGDCICTNEEAYYPPLAKISNFVPGVTLDGYFKGRGLGARWSTPGARSAYMGLFSF